MAGYSKVICIGNLTRDPDLRYTPGGDAVCNFDLAINRAMKAVPGKEKQEEVLFLRVTVWRKQAESCGKFLTKGKRALVEGFLKEETWTGKDGIERSKVGIVADRVLFLSPKPKEAEGETEDHVGDEVPF